MTGKVYLVGAGPGDPELLTLKAWRLLRTADAVLHDDLVSQEILRVIPAVARIYNVGKRCGQKGTRQEEINFLMINLAASGLQVVRLKGGDPLIFGRAGEEIEALQRTGIAYEIVPGITSATGAAAAFGIPLTHRRKSAALVLIAGHRAENSELDWNRLAASGATLVIYMPGDDYSGIAARLKAASLRQETPCAIISRATTPAQHIHRTTISDLAKAPHLAAPTLLMVGDVVGAADDRELEESADFSNFTHSGEEPFAARTVTREGRLQE
jgi:uroporphyrin-III C-methyltransferase